MSGDFAELCCHLCAERAAELDMRDGRHDPVHPQGPRLESVRALHGRHGQHRPPGAHLWPAALQLRHARHGVALHLLRAHPGLRMQPMYLLIVIKQ